MKVITYQSPSGARIDISLAQTDALESRGIWPKDSRGQEFCQIRKGEHEGSPDYTTAELLARCSA